MTGSTQAKTATGNLFCWYELMTTNDAAAEAFYSHAIGWKTKDAGMPGMRYTLLSVGDAPVAGLMTLPSEAAAAGAKPGWHGHVAVDDVDGYAARVKTGGGKIHREPTDIPGIGWFAVAADPQGAVFLLFQPNGTPPAPLPADMPGTIGWHELYANDWQADFDFYSKLFGWQKADAMDMGPMGTYQLFSAGGTTIGGMMNVCGGAVVGWGFYVNVDAIDAAVARVTEKGGKITNGPIQVPTGSWIVNCLDPQGVTFNMVAPKR